MIPRLWRGFVVPAARRFSPPKVGRDPDDDPILAAAVNSRCAYPVTGDHVPHHFRQQELLDWFCPLFRIAGLEIIPLQQQVI
jgi:predicted nucleic acid-binding protein